MNEVKWNTNPIKQWTGNNIGETGARMISESLKTNTTLTKLNLSSKVVMKFDNEMNNEKYNE